MKPFVLKPDQCLIRRIRRERIILYIAIIVLVWLGWGVVAVATQWGLLASAVTSLLTLALVELVAKTLISYSALSRLRVRFYPRCAVIHHPNSGEQEIPWTRIQWKHEPDGTNPCFVIRNNTPTVDRYFRFTHRDNKDNLDLAIEFLREQSQAREVSAFE